MQRALLELGLADPYADVAAWREIGEDVLAASTQQERLLDACLTLARIECGSTRREPVDLAAVAEQTLRAHDYGGLECLVVRAVADGHEARLATRPRIDGGLAIGSAFNTLF
jgi:hypothetical protein